jgi:hypothetical protein
MGNGITDPPRKQAAFWDRCYDFKNIFAEKNSKKWRFWLKTELKYAKILIITLVFEKNAHLFAENWQKSQKNDIITSTPSFTLLAFSAKPLYRIRR